MYREKRVESMLLALRLFGKLDADARAFEWEIMQILIDRGNAEVVHGKLVLRRKERCV